MTSSKNTHSSENPKYILVNPLLSGAALSSHANSAKIAANEIWTRLSKNFKNNLSRSALTLLDTSDDSFHSFEINETNEGKKTSWTLQPLKMDANILNTFRKRLNSDIDSAENMLHSKFSKNTVVNNVLDTETADSLEADSLEADSHESDSHESDSSYESSSITSEEGSNRSIGSISRGNYTDTSDMIKMSVNEKKKGSASQTGGGKKILKNEEFVFNSHDGEIDDESSESSESSDDSPYWNDTEDKPRRKNLKIPEFVRKERKKNAIIQEYRNEMNTSSRMNRLISLSELYPYTYRSNDSKHYPYNDNFSWTYYMNLYPDMNEIYMPVFHKYYPNYISAVSLASNLANDIVNALPKRI